MELEIPDAWQSLRVEHWRDPILVIGAPNSGKSTFARYLYGRLHRYHARLAYLSADVGQATLGPPATMTVQFSAGPQNSEFPPAGDRRMRFVGANSPSGHMLPVLTGLYLLQAYAFRQGRLPLVVDTSGLVSPRAGGPALKWAKVDLLRPCTVVAFQQARELEPILAPLARLPDVRLLVLPLPELTRERSEQERRAYRAEQYRAYFAGARTISLPYRSLAVFPARAFRPGRLLALEDEAGFALALAVVMESDREIVQLYTPWSGTDNVIGLRLGNLRLDLATSQDRQL
jgi:polynucleotide 5'-hydroxyl-kinase GRC3/NOL9